MPSNRDQHVAKEITEGCLALKLRLASRVVTKIYDDALRPFGLRITQLALLALAEERKSLEQAAVCAELQLDDSTLSRNLDRMSARGWLEKISSSDRRATPYRLTSEGRALLRRAGGAWRQAQQETAELLGDKAVKAITAFKPEI